MSGRARKFYGVGRVVSGFLRGRICCGSGGGCECFRQGFLCGGAESESIGVGRANGDGMKGKRSGGEVGICFFFDECCGRVRAIFGDCMVMVSGSRMRSPSVGPDGGDDDDNDGDCFCGVDVCRRRNVDFFARIDPHLHLSCSPGCDDVCVFSSPCLSTWASLDLRP